MKRAREEDAFLLDDRKRRRPNESDHISPLSHELALKILEKLDITDLIACHRVSRHLLDLAEDPQIWKRHYYDRFVRPRASRIPGMKDSEDSNQHLHFSSKISKWLDDEGLVKKGRQTNWKRQYKLRHNWSRGTCSVHEVAVSEQVSVPPLLVQMRDSTIFLADRTDGLRAWNSAAGEHMLAKISWDSSSECVLCPPTALAVDTSNGSGDSGLVAVGFQDGSYTIFELDHKMRTFRRRYTHPSSSNGMLSAVALSYPYFATMTANQLLSVYKFGPTSEGNDRVAEHQLSPPALVHSLHSHTVWPPLSLSIRPSSTKTLISIAYALPTYLSGWTVGIQELHLDPADSTLISSRLASAISPPASSPFRPSNYSIFPFSSPPRSAARYASPATPLANAFSHVAEIHTPPTSLSYSHPYLLVSHPDNTLTLYLVTSTDSTLTISQGKRLWGHTSSVSGTSIGQRGRAVSVSKRGDEVRVWDLEERVGLRRGEAGKNRSASVRVVPESAATTPATAASASPVQSSSTSRSASRAPQDVEPVDASIGETVTRWSDWYRGTEEEEMSIARGWVGFDEENVVLLKERVGRGQSLVVYDFA
ncbi:F-box domain-containing protein 10 [Elsinoe australis]|uniref:F-box domain-containing protein 10 n=1 Tax=Elsinoe australis TaxID=40998 RepID=A0A4U7AN34_9PEZI|nr:F-box domain-containing protein 10 [Elsinoe australis]